MASHAVSRWPSEFCRGRIEKSLPRRPGAAHFLFPIRMLNFRTTRKKNRSKSRFGKVLEGVWRGPGGGLEGVWAALGRLLAPRMLACASRHLWGRISSALWQLLSALGNFPSGCSAHLARILGRLGRHLGALGSV